MNKLLISVVLGITCCFIENSYEQQSAPASPCPEIFKYAYSGEWFGVLSIPSPQLGQTIKINVMLSLRAQLPTSYVGALELLDSREISIQNIRQRRPVRYRIRFPLTSPLPKLTQVMYNNRVICSGPPETDSYVTAIRLEHTLYTKLASQQLEPMDNEEEQYTGFTNVDENVNMYQPKPIQQPDQIPPETVFRPRPPVNLRPEKPVMVKPQFPPVTEAPVSIEQTQSDDEICGKPHNRFQVSPLIVGGQGITRGSWPWLVAVYLNKAAGLSFNCGGNLVSTKVVISAAHCFTTNDKQYQASEVIVFLGRFNIMKWMEKGSVITEVESIHIHSEYMKKDTSFDADVAVMILKNRVQYNEYIRPICLWEGPNNINELTGVMGTVVGWGRDGNGNIVSAEPQKISIPIVSEADCLRSSDTYRYITSNRTFCAGGRNGRGPCNGDSGSGMTIRKNDRWVLRGIVSAALADPVMNTCNLSEYVVFTDAAKFVEWIKSFMRL